MEDELFFSGESPECGRYYCTLCGMVITIDEYNPTIPICQKCNAETWRRL